MAPPPSTRWRPTPDQLTILEQLFVGGTRTPNASQIQRITDHLARYGKIECKNVFYWFQNHKAREKQKIRKRLFKQFQLQQQQQQWYQLQQQFGQATSPTLPPPPPPPPSSLVGLNHPFLYVVGPRYGCGNIFPGFPPQATDQERDAPSSNILDCLLTATKTEKPGAAAAPQPLPPPPPALPTLKPLLNINYYSSSSNNNNNNNNKADDSWVTTLTTTTATSTDGDLTDYSSSSPTAKPALKTLQLFPTTSACSLKEEIINAKEAAAAAEGSHNNSQLTSCSTSTS